VLGLASFQQFFNGVNTWSGGWPVGFKTRATLNPKSRNVFKGPCGLLCSRLKSSNGNPIAGSPRKIMPCRFCTLDSWPFDGRTSVFIYLKDPLMKSNCQPSPFCSFAGGVLIIVCMVAGIGCGDAKQPEDDQKAEVKAAMAAPAKVFQETADYIPAMYLERNEFLDSNAVKYKDKLVLQLSLEKDRNRYRLTVSPTGKSGKILDTAGIKYPKAFVNGLPASSVGSNHVFAEHHTKENDFQKFWDEIKKYRLVNYILFEPAVDSSQHFFYKITGVEKLPDDLSAAHGFATKTYYSHPSNHVWK
jgi:hypothetical protein